MRSLVLSAALLSAAVVLAACSGIPEQVTAPPPPVTPSAAPSAAPSQIPAVPIASAAPSSSPAPSAAPAAAPPPAEVKACPAGMALVPGGKISLGAPKHEVTIASICVDVSETTADEYAACVKTGKCSTDFLSCAPQHTYETPGKGNHPIN